MTKPASRRILIVGCSRSGTTLLQRLLAGHSRVHTFPETGVFLKAFGMRDRVLPWARLGLTLGRERKSLARMLPSQEGRGHDFPPLPPRRFSLARSMEDVASFFDGLARSRGKDIWVEKTPRHVFHARRIRRTVEGVTCIHMVRRGEDVVASIVDRARAYPDRFPRQSDPRYAVRQWNRSLRATQSALVDTGHVVVFYRTLASDPEATLRVLCRVLGMEFQAGMLAPGDPATYSNAEEEWKSGAGGRVRLSASKFEEVFDEKQRSRICRQLNTGLFHRLREQAQGWPASILVSGHA